MPGSIVPKLCNIYSGSDNYNVDRNIVRVRVKFDETDTNDRVYDVPLLSTGSYRTPHPDLHKVLVFLPEDIIKDIAIRDPEKVPVGTIEIKSLMGILIDSAQSDKLPGSIGNNAFHNKSFSGNKNKDRLDFFIPAGATKDPLMSDVRTDDPLGETRVCGIAGATDGSITIRGTNGEISIGEDGIRIVGKVMQTDSVMDKSDVFSTNPVSFLPSLIVLPLPERIPSFKKVASIAGILSASSKAIGLFT